MKRIAAVALLVIVTACAKDPPTWDRPGGTQADLNRDTYECERDSYIAGGGVQYIGFGMVRSTPNPDLYKRCMAARGWTVRGR